MRRLVTTCILCACTAAVGCGGGPEIAPVTGVVKLNNKPYKDAVVSFQPIGDKGNPNPGRGSVALTDENGRFTLVYDNVKPGAVIGKHQVRIFTKFGVEPPSPEGGGESAPGEAPIRIFEPIPPEWNELSNKTFDVPRGGTKEANFDISSKASKKN
ncbi:MAG: DUF4198 domain-containing protein [Gemmataceae bacterium]|nr:DUF4198 domain-containing protein [Gemmataceae bacterium]MCI0739694.1 DUF4198 domain-containing protein [Gemmataceae bacterium]